MTTGSTTKQTVPHYTLAYGNGYNYYGTTSSWNGTDRATTKRPKPVIMYHREVAVKRVTRRGMMNKRVVSYEILRIPVYSKSTPPPRKKQLPGYDDRHPFTKTWNADYRGPGAFAQWAYNGTTHRYELQGFGACPGSAIAPPGNNPPAVAWDQTDLRKLIAKLGVKMRGSDFNLASFLGAESRDTVKFIADTAQTLAESLLAAKRGRIGDAIKIALRSQKAVVTKKGPQAEKRYAIWKNDQLDVYRTLVKRAREAPDLVRKEGWRRVSANSWLEYHLAVEPLLGDAKAAAEALAHALNVENKRSYTVTRKVVVPGLSLQNPAATPLGGILLAINYAAKRGRLAAYLTEDPTLPQLSGLQDPEVVIWNALPLSFVADYWLPIGDWLEARAFATKLVGEFVLSVKQWRYYYHPGIIPYDKVLSNDALNGNAIRTGGQTGTPHWHSEGTFSRTVTSSLVDEVSFPDVKPLGGFSSWQRAATLAALVGSFGTESSIKSRHLR